MNHNFTPQTRNQVPSDSVPTQDRSMHSRGHDQIVVLDQSLPILNPADFGIAAFENDSDGNVVPTKILAHGKLGNNDDALNFAVTLEAEGYKLHGLIPNQNGTALQPAGSLKIGEHGLTLGRAANSIKQSGVLSDRENVLVKANDLWGGGRTYGTSISNGHVTFIIENGQVAVRDNGSTNGTELHVGQENYDSVDTTRNLGKLAVQLEISEDKLTSMAPGWTNPNKVDLKLEGPYLKSELAIVDRITKELSSEEQGDTHGRGYGDVILAQVEKDVDNRQISPRAGLVAAIYMAVGSKDSKNKVQAENLRLKLENLLSPDQQGALAQLMNGLEQMRMDGLDEKIMVELVYSYAERLVSPDGKPLTGMEVFLATVLATAAGTDRTGDLLANCELAEFMKKTTLRKPPRVVVPYR